MNKMAFTKGRLGMMMMMSEMMFMGMDGSVRQRHEPSQESDDDRKRRLAKAEENRKKANGLKEFQYPQGVILALNKKSADKKAKRNNWI